MERLIRCLPCYLTEPFLYIYREELTIGDRAALQSHPTTASFLSCSLAGTGSDCHSQAATTTYPVTLITAATQRTNHAAAATATATATVAAVVAAVVAALITS